MAKKSLTKTKTGSRETLVSTEPVKKLASAKAAQGSSETKSPADQPLKINPTTEEIARRAFEIYMGRGQATGRDKEDWIQAERELRAEANRNN